MSKVLTEKIWRQRPWDEKNCRQLAAKMNIPLEIAALLDQRGMNDPETIEFFLHPKLDQLPSPFTMKDMDRAVQIIGDVVLHQQSTPVLIYGDYDVDGITGAAILYIFLRSVGIEVFYCFPNRLTEGYGLHSDKLIQLYKQHKKSNDSQANNPILITVDCGISNFEEVRIAKLLGYKVIITDHHQPKDLLPEADAILNPLQRKCNFPFKHLAGVGVAFFLVMGLRSYLNNKEFWSESNLLPNLKEYLDLVALGTIADVVPVTGINRILIKAGLEVLANTSRIGLQKLLKNTGLHDLPLNTENVAFKICPKLNAAGRMSSADIAFKLLTSDSIMEISETVREIENLNLLRKHETNTVYESAQALANPLLTENKFSLVLGNSNWHPGVLGIAATQLMTLYNRPTLLFNFKDQFAKGSGRSSQGINLNDILSSCEEYLIKYGGHANAIGCVIDLKKFDMFAEKFEVELKNRISAKAIQPVLWIDLKLHPSELNSKEFINYYKMLQPFGKGNEEPVFISAKPNKLIRPRKVGRESLRFVWQENGFSCHGYAFGFADYAHGLENNKALIAFKLRNNLFSGNSRWEIKAEDIRIVPTI